MHEIRLPKIECFTKYFILIYFCPSKYGKCQTLKAHVIFKRLFKIKSIALSYLLFQRTSVCCCINLICCLHPQKMQKDIIIKKSFIELEIIKQYKILFY